MYFQFCTLNLKHDLQALFLFFLILKSGYFLEHGELNNNDHIMFSVNMHFTIKVDKKIVRLDV